MSATQVQVLLAVHDTTRCASAAQVLIQSGAAVSMLPIHSAEHLLERLQERVPTLLVLEMDRDWGGLEKVRARYPDLPVVAVVNEATEDLVFALSRLGVQDVWTLPVDVPSMVERARGTLDRLQAGSSRNGGSASLNAEDNAGSSFDASAGSRRQDETVATTDANAPLEPPVMVGSNPRMVEIRDTIQKVAGTDVTVLIRGESGVGKEIVARLLFEYSRRKQKPFVKVNCAAIPHDLLESELFGYESGAFTGAVRSKPGKFELADHGTLFLDEIAEMHPMLQAKLLHVLQDGRFSRLGAKRDVSVDVRVICATNKLLEERVREGLFREDLLYRINVVTVYLPPLRERRDEIPGLTEYLLRKYAAQYSRAFRPLSAEVTRRMMEYDWPGNIRELENLCKRFVIVGSETQILRELSHHNHLSPQFTDDGKSSSRSATGSESSLAGPSGLSLLEVGRRAAWQAERQAIGEMLEATHWNRREAARRLQVSYKALLNKIKLMQLDEGRPSPETPATREKSTIQ